MQATVQTTPPKGKDRGTLRLDAKGRYAQQPITARFIGGALLSFVADQEPYPVDLTVQNGPTTATLKGDVVHPMSLAGAHLKLHFAGPDMALLYPLTGVPIPRTPAYTLTGTLDYSRNHILFKEFDGRLGSSDIGGTIELDPHQKPMNMQATLRSRQVNLADLSGFIGGRPAETAAEKQQDAKKRPSCPIRPSIFHVCTPSTRM